jgi:hypothetical protein
LKDLIEDKINNGDHSTNGKSRFDFKKDERYNGYVTAKSIRLYLEEIPQELYRVIPVISENELNNIKVA